MSIQKTQWLSTILSLERPLVVVTYETKTTKDNSNENDVAASMVIDFWFLRLDTMRASIPMRWLLSVIYQTHFKYSRRQEVGFNTQFISHSLSHLFKKIFIISSLKYIRTQAEDEN